MCGTGETTMWVWVGSVLLVPTPSMWGPGRPSLAGRGTNFLVGGVRSAGGWQRRFSWDAPPYAGDRDASPTRGRHPLGWHLSAFGWRYDVCSVCISVCISVRTSLGSRLYMCIKDLVRTSYRHRSSQLVFVDLVCKHTVASCVDARIYTYSCTVTDVILMCIAVSPIELEHSLARSTFRYSAGQSPT